MARLSANENFPQPVVEELRRLGHDVLTLREIGKAGQSWPDEQVLDFARTEGRGLLTLNRKHFLRLDQQAPGHAGLILCTFDPDFVGQAGRIHAAIQEQQGLLAGKVLRVSRPNSPKASST